MGCLLSLAVWFSAGADSFGLLRVPQREADEGDKKTRTGQAAAGFFVVRLSRLDQNTAAHGSAARGCRHIHIGQRIDLACSIFTVLFSHMADGVSSAKQ